MRKVVISQRKSINNFKTGAKNTQDAEPSPVLDRTIRNYISNGILHGEIINGLWHFTSEEVKSFIAHPAVRPSILAKHHSAVYDFLLENKKDLCETCMIVDIPGRREEEIAEYFCYRISNEGFHKIQFSFDGVTNVPRIILKGNTDDVLRLVNGYFQEHPLNQSVV